MLQVTGFIKHNGVHYENPTIKVSIQILMDGIVTARANVFTEESSEPRVYIAYEFHDNTLFNGCSGNSMSHMRSKVEEEVKIDLETNKDVTIQIT